MVVDDMNIDEKLLKAYKRKARALFQALNEWYKLPMKMKYKTPPPDAAVYESDFILSYRSNGLKRHKGYMLHIKKTKKNYLI